MNKTSPLLLLTLLIFCTLTGCIDKTTPGTTVTPHGTTTNTGMALTPEITETPTQAYTHNPTLPTSPQTPSKTLAPTATPTSVPVISGVNIAYANALNTKGSAWGYSPNTRALIEKYGGFCIKDTGHKRIYLTYNLGTEYGHTDDLLDILKEKNVKASFFSIGAYVRSNKSLIQRIVNEGHLLGSHGETHTNLTTWSTEKVIEDLNNMQNRYKGIFGNDFRIHYYRPPYGVYSERDLYIARQMGLTCVFWSYTYTDWYADKPYGADYVHDLYMENLHDGIILQLHLSNRDNVDVLERFIDDARALGYEFYRVDDIK